jgi:hypothetical protein
MDNFLAGQEKESYDTAIRLIPTREQVQVGEEFDVQIELVNPNQVSFDSVSLYMLYDNRVLEAVDRDDNNWITAGITVHDGASHDKFPLEMSKSNRINPKSGKSSIPWRLFTNRSAPRAFSPAFDSRRFVRSNRRICFLGSICRIGSPRGDLQAAAGSLGRDAQYRDGVYSSPISIYPK